MPINNNNNWECGNENRIMRNNGTEPHDYISHTRLCK